jgi:hypothetical protein
MGLRPQHMLRPGSRAAVLRRSEPTCFSSASDDRVGGCLAIRAERAKERSNQTPRWILTVTFMPGTRGRLFRSSMMILTGITWVTF